MGTMRFTTRPVAATAAVAAALALLLSGCNSGDDNADAKPGVSQKAGDEIKLPSGIPTSFDELEKWRNGGWKKWDRDDWLREAKDFINPIIKDLWGPDRMRDAQVPDQGTNVSEDQGITDPEPQPVAARALQSPYTRSSPAVGKVFFDAPEGPMVCSGTVIEDPAHPGKSNLVATAGHCVHAGKSGGWFRNITFVPAYNSAGRSAAYLKANKPTRDQLAPLGVFWATKAQTTDQWIAEGKTEGGSGAPYDFAVLKVKPQDGGSRSLQEKTGSAMPVWFDAPKVSQVGALTAMGYPAAKPFDGQRVYSCQDRPGRLSVKGTEPTMYRIGCTMTAGASGGGWFAQRDGRPALVSVTSIGPLDHTWLAGAHLGPEAKSVFTKVSGS